MLRVYLRKETRNVSLLPLEAFMKKSGFLKKKHCGFYPSVYG